MALSNINILRQNGGLARPLASNDGISAFVFYDENLTVTPGNYKLTSDLDVASVLGITGDTIAEGTVVKYHVEEYFRQSESSLYVSIVDAEASDFAEVKAIKDFANGEIRQLGVYDTAELDYAAITTLQGVADECEEEKEPLQIVYSAPLVSGDTIEDLTDLKLNESPRVSYIIGEDTTEDSTAATLRAEGAVLVGSIGTVLGSVSKASVHENIGWVSKFNLVESEFQDPGFIDGSKLSEKSKTLLQTLNGYHYLFLRKFVGSNGTFHSYSYTTVSETSDFSTIENNRTYDKAFRGIYASLLPQVNSPLYVDAQGKLDSNTVAYFTELTESSLKTMQDARELSAFSVSIDPEQNVLSTSKIEVTARIVPVGVARTIEVKLGFSLSI